MSMIQYEHHYKNEHVEYDIFNFSPQQLKK